MWYALQGLDVRKLRQAIHELNYFWLGGSFIIAALAHGVRALRWKMQLTAAGQNTPFWKTYHALMVGNFTNIITPQLGEIIRCTMLRRTGKVPLNLSMGTVAMEHLIDLVFLLAITASVLLLDLSLMPTMLQTLLPELSAHAILIKQNLLVVISITGIVITLAIVYRKQINQFPFIQPITSFLTGMRTGFLSLFQLQQKGHFIFLTLLTWFLYFLKGYIGFFALPLTSHLGWMAGVSVLAFGTLAMWFPVQGGFGIFYLLVQACLLAYGISEATGLLYALIIHSLWTLQIVLMGSISFFLGLITVR